MYHPKLFTYSGFFPNNVTYTIKGTIRIVVDLSKCFFTFTNKLYSFVMLQEQKNNATNTNKPLK